MYLFVSSYSIHDKNKMSIPLISTSSVLINSQYIDHSPSLGSERLQSGIPESVRRFSGSNLQVNPKQVSGRDQWTLWRRECKGPKNLRNEGQSLKKRDYSNLYKVFETRTVVIMNRVGLRAVSLSLLLSRLKETVGSSRLMGENQLL